MQIFKKSFLSYTFEINDKDDQRGMSPGPGPGNSSTGLGYSDDFDSPKDEIIKSSCFWHDARSQHRFCTTQEYPYYSGGGEFFFKTFQIFKIFF